MLGQLVHCCKSGSSSLTLAVKYNTTANEYSMENLAFLTQMVHVVCDSGT